MKYSIRLQVQLDKVMTAAARDIGEAAVERESYRAPWPKNVGCMLYAFVAIGLSYIGVALRQAFVDSALVVTAVFAMRTLWRWYVRMRAEEAARAGYSKRKARLEAQWWAAIEVVESHAGTLAADHRRIMTTDKWGRSVGADAWRAARDEFAFEVLPTLVDCSWVTHGFQGLLLEAIEEVVHVRQADAERDRQEALQGAPLHELSGHQFEILCANVLAAAGWQTELTPGSGDQGVDIVATKNTSRVAIQCKHHRAPVDNAAVQQVVAGLLHYACRTGVVVSSSGFTRSAQALAASNRVRLIAFEQLRDLAP